MSTKSHGEIESKAVETIDTLDFGSDEEEEEEENHPFRHRIRMTRWEWLRTYLLTIFIMPIRVFCLLNLVTITWIVAFIVLYGLDEETKARVPFTGWRKCLQGSVTVFGRIAFWISGFIPVKVKGTAASRDEAPIIVVAPHSSYFDGFVVFFIHPVPYIVSRYENKRVLFFGKCIELIQAIFVSREEPDSRRKTLKEIIRRANEKEWSQLIIFPEGSTSNRQALMSFKLGAFIPGKPIQPVLIRYPNRIDTITWTWDQPHGAKTAAWLTFSQPFTRVQLEFLPVYHPSHEETQDPKIYMTNVRKAMAKALNVPLCDKNYEEVKAEYAHKYKCKRKRRRRNSSSSSSRIKTE